MDLIQEINNFSNQWYGCFILFIIGMGLLVVGGNFLVDGGVGFANRFRINTMVVGLTIIAFSTSAPELAFNVLASLNGHGEMSLGNIFGSNIANLSIVLGVGAVIYGQKLLPGDALKLPKRFVEAEYRGLKSFTVIVGIITLLAFFFGKEYWWLGLHRPVGILLLGFFVWFIVYLVLPAAKTTTLPEIKYSAKASISLLIVGLLLLGVGGKSAEISAVSAAKIFGISEIFIGVTIVAFATSLPELVTTIIAAKKGEPDMAVGNVIGSNFFNMLFVLPITIIVNPIPTPTGKEPLIYLSVMVLLTFVAVKMMKNQKDLTRNEGWVLISFYLVFMAGITIWKTMG